MQVGPFQLLQAKQAAVEARLELHRTALRDYWVCARTWNCISGKLPTHAGASQQRPRCDADAGTAC